MKQGDSERRPSEDRRLLRVPTLCATVEVDGPCRVDLLRTCLEAAVDSDWASKRPAGKLIEWVGTSGLPTPAEAGLLFILGSLERLLATRSSREALFHAAFYPCSSRRCFLCVSVSAEACDAAALEQVLRDAWLSYARHVQKPLEVTTRVSPVLSLGGVVRVPFLVEPPGKDLVATRWFQQLVAIHSVIAWLIGGSNQVEVDLCLSGRGACVPLMFELSGDLTLGEALERVEAALLEFRPRRTFSPIRSAIVQSRLADESRRIGEMTFTTVDMTQIGAWKAKTMVVEVGSETMVTVECDVVDKETIADLLEHAGWCLEEVPETLAAEVSLTRLTTKTGH
jgi:hypothetical protein